MLLAALILMVGLILLAEQSFALGSFLAQVASSSPPTSAQAASTLRGIISAGAFGLYVIAIAVLLVGPGNMLMYLQKSRKGGEYAGDGLIVAARVIFALAVVLTANYVVTVGDSIVPAPSGSTPSISLSKLVLSGEIIVLYLIVGFVLAVVGRILLHHPRELERQVPRDDKFERTSRYLGYAATALLILGVLLDVLIIFEYFSGGVTFIPSSQAKANLFGWGIVLLGICVILGGLRDMFHAWAFAAQPYAHPPVATPMN